MVQEWLVNKDPDLNYREAKIHMCNHSQTIPSFNELETEVFQKLLEKEKILQINIFSFFHNVFYPHWA